MTDWEALERAKYRRAWEWKPYRSQADGDPVVHRAFEVMGCQPGETLIDWGCGSGRPAVTLRRLGLIVTGFDIADNCLDPGCSIPLVVGTMWAPPEGLEADYAFSTDVLEHIPPVHIDACLDVLRKRTAKAAYIQVDTAIDTSGDKIDPPDRYHLTIKPAKWWRRQLESRWREVLPQPASYSRAGFLCLK